ncbi:hypothetical protein JL720_3257 [Aureococcus anophagefferens]|nr:hypothetical protein JL720_3257 [Aureococcus anophagefferens]
MQPQFPPPRRRRGRLLCVGLASVVLALGLSLLPLALVVLRDDGAFGLDGGGVLDVAFEGREVVAAGAGRPATRSSWLHGATLTSATCGVRATFDETRRKGAPFSKRLAVVELSSPDGGWPLVELAGMEHARPAFAARLRDVDFGAVWRARRAGAVRAADVRCDVEVDITLWRVVPWTLRTEDFRVNAWARDEDANEQQRSFAVTKAHAGRLVDAVRDLFERTLPHIVDGTYAEGNATITVAPRPFNVSLPDRWDAIAGACPARPSP